MTMVSHGLDGNVFTLNFGYGVHDSLVAYATGFRWKVHTNLSFAAAVASNFQSGTQNLTFASAVISLGF